VYEAAGCDFTQIEKAGLRFEPIDATTDERSFGFVCFDDMLQPLGFTPVQKSQFVAVSLRLDTRRVSPAVLKKYVRAALEQELALTGKKWVSRERKREIVENTKLMLLAKALPVPSVTDVIFSMEDGRIWLCSGNAKIQSLFEGLFRNAFPEQARDLIRLDVANILLPALEDRDDAGVHFLKWAFWQAMNGFSEGLAPGRSVALIGEDGRVGVVDPTETFAEAKKLFPGAST
jgi:hypothetical protein